jgi:hypothetical protein
MNLPPTKRKTLNDIVNNLKSIDNVIAIVLGGSYATGNATDTSDIDIGIYYFNDNPFDIGSIKSVAEKHAIDNNPTVTGFYEWGPWVNGGAWIQTASGKVDFLYRNIEQVRSTIEKAQHGEWENSYEQQPPFGFSSVMYLAETKSCIALHDPGKIISNLKIAVRDYPPKLKESIIRLSLWHAEFTIWHADYFHKKNDVYNIVGCLARTVKNIVTVLFAINEMYPISDKRAIDILEKTNKKPSSLTEKIENILCVNKSSIGNNILLLKSLFDETVQLTGAAYKPFYNLGER